MKSSAKQVNVLPVRTAHWAGRTTEKSKSHTFLCKSMTFIRFGLPCQREVPSAARRRDSCPSAGAAAYKARPVGIPPAACGVHLPLTREAQRVKKHRLCYIENVGATIGRPPAWRSNALSGMAFLHGIRARASNARPYRSFSTVCYKMSAFPDKEALSTEKKIDKWGKSGYY